MKSMDEAAKIDERIENIENSKDDSSRMFAAVKELKRMKPKQQILVRDGDGNLIANPNCRYR